MTSKLRRLVQYEPDWHAGQLVVFLVIALPLTILLVRAVPWWTSLDAFTVRYYPEAYQVLFDAGLHVRPPEPPWWSGPTWRWRCRAA